MTVTKLTGILFISIALFFLSQSVYLGIGSLVAPGFFPFVVSCILGILGILKLISHNKDPVKIEIRNLIKVYAWIVLIIFSLYLVLH